MNTVTRFLTMSLTLLAFWAAAFAQGQLELRVTSSSDDAEEFALETTVGPAGSVYLDSSDLELTEDAGTTQLVGLRFAEAEIPPGATITSAYLQFTVDEPSDAATGLELWGEASDDAATFQAVGQDLSRRPLTTATASWEVAAWPSAGEAGEAQRSPDLSAVLQEIVNRPGWQTGNALVLFIGGTGKRVAEAYDGSPAQAPLLMVTFEGGGSEAAIPEPATPETEPSAVTPQPQTPAETPDKAEAPSATGVQPGEGARVQQVRYTLSPVGNSGLRGSLLIADYSGDTVILTLFLTGNAPQDRGAALRSGSCEAPGDALLRLEPSGRGGYSTTLANANFATLIQEDLQLSVYENPDASGAVLACGEVDPQ